MMKHKKCITGCIGLGFLLAGCRASEQRAQFTQHKPVALIQSDVMTELCKDNAARRYNTAPQRIKINGIEQYHGSYEMAGYTARREGFTCSFDENGQFQHLSMRQAR